MRVVPLEAFRDKVPFSVAIAAVERGFRALGRGEAALPDPMVLELREQQAEVHVKGAHIAGGRHIVLKVATGFYRDRKSTRLNSSHSQISYAVFCLKKKKNKKKKQATVKRV